MLTQKEIQEVREYNRRYDFAVRSIGGAYLENATDELIEDDYIYIRTVIDSEGIKEIILE